MITEQQVISVQEAWADGVVAIGKIYAKDGNYQQAAADFISRHYGHELGDVFFKPTLAKTVPFRHNFSDTLSYFAGGVVADFATGKLVEDQGFALRPWQKIWFDEARKIYCTDEVALSMGHYFMQAKGQSPLMVEFSFAYIMDAQGDLKIKLHHSSLPYQGS